MQTRTALESPAHRHRTTDKDLRRKHCEGFVDSFQEELLRGGNDKKMQSWQGWREPPFKRRKCQ